MYFEEDCEDGVKTLYSYEKVLVSKDTGCQKVHLLWSPKFGKMLFLDGEAQSSSLDEGLYHEMLVHPLLSSLPSAKSVLIIGGGEGATLREVVKYKNLERIVMVDYDAELIEIFKKECPEYSNGAYDDPRVELRTMSIWDFLAENNTNFDAVICDLNDGFNNIVGLMNEVSNISNFVTVQVGSCSPDRKEIMKWQLESFNKSFKYKFFPYKVFVPFFQSEWLFFTNYVGFGRFNVETNNITPGFFRANMVMPRWWNGGNSLPFAPPSPPFVSES